MDLAILQGFLHILVLRHRWTGKAKKARILATLATLATQLFVVLREHLRLPTGKLDLKSSH
jgi:hypothetical protein